MKRLEPRQSKPLHVPRHARQRWPPRSAPPPREPHPHARKDRPGQDDQVAKGTGTTGLRPDLFDLDALFGPYDPTHVYAPRRSETATEQDAPHPARGSIPVDRFDIGRFFAPYEPAYGLHAPSSEIHPEWFNVNRLLDPPRQVRNRHEQASAAGRLAHRPATTDQAHIARRRARRRPRGRLRTDLFDVGRFFAPYDPTPTAPRPEPRARTIHRTSTLWETRFHLGPALPGPAFDVFDDEWFYRGAEARPTRRPDAAAHASAPQSTRSIHAEDRVHPSPPRIPWPQHHEHPNDPLGAPAPPPQAPPMEARAARPHDPAETAAQPDPDSAQSDGDRWQETHGDGAPNDATTEPALRDKILHPLRNRRQAHDDHRPERDPSNASATTYADRDWAMVYPAGALLIGRIEVDGGCLVGSSAHINGTLSVTGPAALGDHVVVSDTFTADGPVSIGVGTDLGPVRLKDGLIAAPSPGLHLKPSTSRARAAALLSRFHERRDREASADEGDGA